MRCRNAIVAAATGLAGSLPLAAAWTPPDQPGFTKAWESPFIGPAGSPPSADSWKVLNGNLGINLELQTYTSDSRNVQLSGGDTLQIMPLRDGGSPGGWTSGRVESTYHVAPTPGKITKAETVTRIGNNGGKAGIWPAVWLLGANVGEVGWPACGELDLLEMRNGDMTGHGVVHCDVAPGGICNEPVGIVSDVAIPNADWHTWTVVWDLTAPNWADHSITWFLDGNVQYHQITGARIGNVDVWNSLAQNPMFFVINLAVGGAFPGSPNPDTADGPNSMLEVGYLVVYVSN